MRAVLAGLALIAFPLAAQTPTTINLYHYILGVDVPESPAFVALGVAPSPVLLGSAPKPLALSATTRFTNSSGRLTAVALEVTPYYLFGGGVRSLTSYRTNSIAGRLTRVLIKTLLSLGVASRPGDEGALDLALGIRSTIHDPHDPVLNSPFPEQVAAALAAAGIAPHDPYEESLDHRGADLTSQFAATRQAMRRRSGDPQLSMGWGVAARAAHGVVSGDSLGRARHVIWFAAQHPTSARYDLLATLQWQNAFRADSGGVSIGAGVRRKGDGADVQVTLAYDSRVKRWEPGLLIDARVSTHLGLIGSIGTNAEGASGVLANRAHLTIGARWFAASDQP